MKTTFALALAVLGCSSASSSSGTLVPGQIDADGPSAVRPPSSSGSGVGPPSPPPNFESPKGCPSSRPYYPDRVADLSEDDIRAHAIGIYRICDGGKDGLEIRIDPESGGLVWYVLDARFVRIEGIGMTGTIEVNGCDRSVCSVVWASYGEASSIRNVSLYLDPTVLVLTDPSAFEGSPEWVRVGK